MPLPSSSLTPLRTRRLTLVAATLEHVGVELDTPERLSALLNAYVSSEWPTGEYDRDAMEYFRARFEEGGKEVEGWYGWYAIRDADAQSQSALVGAGGYFGPPDSDGVVEVGYSMLPEWQRMGFATEMVQALVDRAFSYAQVTKVIAHTTESNPASIGVIARCGFVAAGAGREPGTVRFELSRKP